MENFFKKHRKHVEKNIYSIDMNPHMSVLKLKNQLDKLRKMDLSTLGYRKIHNILDNLLFNKEIHCFGIAPLQMLYRGRKIDSINDVKYKSHFWLAPKEKIETRGRLNEANEQIFYGTSSFGSVFNEIEFEVGNLIVVSENLLVDNSTNLLFPALGFSSKSLEELSVDPVLKQSIRYLEGKKYGSDIEINGVPISSMSEQYVIEDFFHYFLSLKKKTNHHYKITNVIGKQFLENSYGIAYPNINTYGINSALTGLNFAIKADSINNLYFPNRIWIIKIKAFDAVNAEIGFDIVQSADKLDDDEKIIWSSTEIGTPIQKEIY